MEKNQEFTLPLIPKITLAEIHKFKSEGKVIEELFNLNKLVMTAVLRCANIMPDSPGIRKIPSIHYAILAGNLNRCCRLMLAVNNLSSRGLFGETTRLFMRCIVESSIRVRWLCLKDSNDMFYRYICDGLKKELLLMNLIGPRFSYQLLSERVTGC